MWPVPLQRGQAMWLRLRRAPGAGAGATSPAGRSARSCRSARARGPSCSASRRRFSTSRWFFGALHVDEVDDDQAAQVAQAQLARDLVGGFEVGVERGRLDVAAACGARRVDVDRDQRLGVVDHDRAAGGQRAPCARTRISIWCSIWKRENSGTSSLVELDACARCSGITCAHELLRLLVDVVGVDQDLADVVDGSSRGSRG